MATNQQKLDAIRMGIINEKVCPELAKQATQLVFGDGSPKADLIFIGEAPGKNEDIQGKPFVGAAGKFLNEMLNMISLKREDVYITNIVKYRPHDNREPLPEEKKAFMPYLEAQLAVIRPKIVITLGSHSLSCFLPDLRISDCHGQPKRIRIKLHEPNLALKDKAKQFSTEVKDDAIFVILPLFHPAAALYNGGMRQTLIDDFAKIPKVLEQIANYKMTISKV
ncbi:MAG: uracil-DNA glycosylase [Candidatus Saccharimonadales bacterium]